MAHSSRLSIEEQVKMAIENLPKRFKAELFLAYFQAFSNTYADIKILEKKSTIVFFIFSSVFYAT